MFAPLPCFSRMHHSYHVILRHMVGILSLHPKFPQQGDPRNDICEIDPLLRRPQTFGVNTSVVHSLRNDTQ